MKIAVLETQVQRVLEKQKERTERVRANEKVVAAIGLFGSVDILLAVFSIPLAAVFAFASFSAQIISSRLTSVPEAISLHIASSLKRYCVDSISS